MVLEVSHLSAVDQNTNEAVLQEIVSTPHRSMGNESPELVRLSLGLERQLGPNARLVEEWIELNQLNIVLAGCPRVSKPVSGSRVQGWGAASKPHPGFRVEGAGPKGFSCLRALLRVKGRGSSFQDFESSHLRV